MRSVNLKLVALFVSIIMLCAAGIIGITASSLPYNSLRSLTGHNKNMLLLLPEGWGFFTRNPREDVIWTFVRKDNHWEAYSRQNNSTAGNLFGLKRNARFNGIIYAELFKSLKPDDWVMKKNLDLNQVNSLPYKPEKVYCKFDYPELCGKTILLIRTRTLPWAWRNTSKGSSGITSIYSQIYVECAKEN